MTSTLRNRPTAAFAGATGLVLAGLLLSGCGGSSSAESTTDASAVASEVTSEASSIAESAPADETSGESGAAAEVPDGWPAEVLVPSGTTVLSNERGAGWDLLIEGIDEAELKSLVDQMTAAGFTSPGITDMGSGAWIAELTGPVGVVTYSYETGGAGLPNVHVVFMPAS